MALLSWILRFLLVLFVVRLVVRFIASAMAPARRTGARGPRGPIPGAKQTERLGGTLMRDPECGTYVSPASAISVPGPNGPVHFCSTTCRDAWLAKGGRAQARPA